MKNIIKNSSILIICIALSSIIPITITIKSSIFIIKDFNFNLLQMKLNIFQDNSNIVSYLGLGVSIFGIAFKWRTVIKLLYSVLTLFIPIWVTNYFIKNTLNILIYKTEDIEPAYNTHQTPRRILEFIFYLLNFEKINIRNNTNSYTLFTKLDLKKELNQNSSVIFRRYSETILFYIKESNKK